MFKPSRLSVLFAGLCALILSLGVARYSFTPMIPAMAEQAGVDSSLAGWLAGWNYMGYLTGLFIVWLVSDLRAKDFFYRYGLVVAVIATALMAAHDNRLIWYVSRYFAGIATAAGFMLGTGLVMNWLHHNNHEGELGLHFSGVGLGIIFSAIVVDMTGLDSWLALNWRLQWVALAIVGIALLIPATFLLPRPKEREIEMAREGDMLVKVDPPSAKWLLLLQAAYFCAGFSNTLNVTFTSLITELQPIPGFGAKVWMLVGIAAAVAPYLWDRLARYMGPLDTLRVAFSVNILANLTLAMTTSTATTMLASVLFGFSFMGIVSLTLSTVGRLYGTKATQVMAKLTLGYCIAQILSPIMSGIIAQATGSFTLPLWIVSGLMLIGLGCLMALRGEGAGTRVVHSR